jgi:hypothetical protein
MPWPHVTLDIGRSSGAFFGRRFGLRDARAGRYVMGEHAEEAEQREGTENGLEEPLPDGVAPGNSRILGEASVALGIGGVVEHIDDMGSTDGGRVVDAGVLPAKIVFELSGSLFGDELHVFLAAKLQAASRTGLDAGGFQALADAIGAESALVNFFRHRVEAGDIEGTARDTILAADTVFLVEVDDAVGIFDDSAISWAGGEAARIGAVHALILTHEPLDRAVWILVLIELDEVPEIPVRLRHSLVGVVEGGGLERHVVPFDAGDLAGFAADAGGGVDELADLEIALHAQALRRTSVARDLLSL